MRSDDVISFDPADYRGRQALLLLFAPSVKSPVFESQMGLFQGEEEAFQARGLVLVQLFHEGESCAADRRVDRASALRWRRQYGVAPDGFWLVLLDRDGNELRRTDTPLKPEAVYEALGSGAPPA